MMNKFLLCFAFLLCLVSMRAQTLLRPDYLPDGWVIPDAVSLTPGTGWQYFASRGNIFPFYATGNYNGDDSPDYAWILQKEDGSTWGVFVFLSNRSGSFDMVDLSGGASGSNTVYSGPITEVEISSLTRWQPLCKYENGQVSRRVQMKYDAIFVGINEGGRIAYYFDASTGNFDGYFNCD